MAKLIVGSTKAEKVVVVEQPSFTITLSCEEAIALYAVLRHVGGFTDTSARKYTDAIARALEDAGVPAVPDLFDGYQSLYFFLGSDKRIDRVAKELSEELLAELRHQRELASPGEEQ